MHQRVASLVAIVVTAFVAACGPPRASVPHGLESGTFFLCCTLRFNSDHDASDAGYAYESGTTLPAGTPVHVVRDEGSSVTFQTFEGNERFHLIFRYGRTVITAAQYFQEVLLLDDPRGELARLRPDIAGAIARGELNVGMTKAEALWARGYPPRHRTSGIDADEWLYYQSATKVLRVRFGAGRITDITPDSAPGS